jgi:hypothetical protein
MLRLSGASSCARSRTRHDPLTLSSLAQPPSAIAVTDMSTAAGKATRRILRLLHNSSQRRSHRPLWGSPMGTPTRGAGVVQTRRSPSPPPCARAEPARLRGVGRVRGEPQLSDLEAGQHRRDPPRQRRGSTRLRARKQRVSKHRATALGLATAVDFEPTAAGARRSTAISAPRPRPRRGTRAEALAENREADCSMRLARQRLCNTKSSAEGVSTASARR